VAMCHVRLERFGGNLRRRRADDICDHHASRSHDDLQLSTSGGILRYCEHQKWWKSKSSIVREQRPEPDRVLKPAPSYQFEIPVALG